ncbi:hypothetical protein NW766_010019 [Fusarium irregulare]|uniref:Uncharacterized protein n=1 Tax=Fusarium irregulare TaxID=2494466 RepID=A0A9W8U6V7_9HYPO|nr:hypothetical protein NW766_010019 [Fusarium irregulare]
MEQTDTLISDYINFNDQNAGLTGAELIEKELTFCAAAAISHLCDKQEWGANIDECLHQGTDFKFIRELDLVSSVGALATSSSCLAIFDHEPIPNAWKEGKNGISVITFGSPSCHFNDPGQSSTSWKMHLSKNFHHVINPNDYVPFALNDASKRFKQNLSTLRTPLEAISPTIKMLWPIFENCLDFLSKKTGKFCHFGCMYSISTKVPGIQNCLQILSARDLPQIPGAREVDEYHKMSHYFHCVKNSIGSRLPQNIVSQNNSGIMSSDLPSVILPMPGTVVNCSGVVDINRLTMSLDVDSAIMLYLLGGAFFKRDEREIPLTIIGYLPNTEDPFKYTMEGKDEFVHIGEASVAVQQGVVLRDVFGRSTTIEVDEMRQLGLDKASQPDTFESIRLAMVRVLVARTSKVQGFRAVDASPNAHSTEQITKLDEKVRFVVNRIDSLVSDASPHLVVSQMGHAFDILEKRWPRDFKTDEDFQVSVPGEFSDGGLLSGIPAFCPRALRKLITDMSGSGISPKITKGEATIKAWTNANRPKLAQQFPNVPNLARALEKYSQDLYRRPTDPSERTEQAISQFQDIMGVIQLCHLIIITQLDAPYEWHCSFTEGGTLFSVTLGMGPSYLSWTALPGLISQVAFGLGLTRPDDMVEDILLKHVQENLPSSHTSETLEKWRTKLETGLETPLRAWENPRLAQVTQLRIQLLDKLCIGVQGSTEAGKSQMLTVLTGASKDHFQPGSSSLCRTLGIQSYNSSRLGATFLDSPAFDDQIPQIKYMADVFQELFAVVIIVIPMERTRSEATEKALRVAVNLLLNHDDKRPLRILLSRADGLDFNRKDKEVFRATLRDVKEQFMSSLRSAVGEDFSSSRKQKFGEGIVCVPETLDDIVKPFSTHAQMDLDGIRALSDCGSDYSCKIERASHFENLLELADAGEIWDIESLRSWLQELSPGSVPMSDGRVRHYCD